MTGQLIAREAAAVLGVGVDELRKLASVNLLDSTPAGRSTLYLERQVRELAERSRLDSSASPAVAVRVGEPRETGRDPLWPQRQWVGWREDWPEGRKRDACRGWFRVPAEYRAPGTALLVLASVVVVAVYRIAKPGTTEDNDTATLPGGMCRFEITAATKAQRDEFTGHLLYLPPGPNAVSSRKWPSL